MIRINNLDLITAVSLLTFNPLVAQVLALEKPNERQFGYSLFRQDNNYSTSREHHLFMQNNLFYNSR